MSIVPPLVPAFLASGGEMGRLMREMDWSGSPLGPPHQWPQSLCTVVGLLLNSKFPMFVAWGPELGFLYNDAYMEILGAKHPRALGARFYDIWSEIWEDIYPSIEKALAGEASYHENRPLLMQRRGYEEQTWFTFSYSPALDETGKVAGMFCVCTETTGEVLAARTRAKELEDLRQMFQQAPGIMAYLSGPEHVFEMHNDSFRALIGRSAVGKKVRDALPELRNQGFFQLLDRVYQSGESFVGEEVSVSLQRQPAAPLEERFINFVYQPVRDARGMVIGIFVEGSDITRSVLANRALQESEQRLLQLANTIPQMAWMADPDGRVHWHNDRWFEYFGAPPPDADPERDWETFVHPQDLPTVQEKWKQAVQSGSRYIIKARLRSASGEYRTFAGLAAPLRDASGRIVQWFGTNTDVTDIELAQEEMAAANRRKDEFLAMLAHELRNPLAPICTAAELLRAASADEGRVRRTSEIISRQVEHMTKLVDDLLDVSRVTRGLISLQEEVLDVRSLVNSAYEQVQPLIQARKQRFMLTPLPHPAWVRGDRTRLVQVFSNILNNAAKYTPPGGSIQVEISDTAEEVEIAVEDNGIGISRDLLAHIFELFTQAERSPDRSQGGLGLGLALVRSLVELQGGHVHASSPGVGGGSRFTVRLPLVTPPLELGNAGRSDNAGAAPALQRPLLVVDDNVDAALTLAMLLESLGYQVSVAHRADEALEQAADLGPPILFVDIGLPDMDGHALARRLRGLPQLHSATLVAVTGYGQAQDRQRALDAGFDHHLVKPVKLSTLENLLAGVRATMASDSGPDHRRA